MLMTVGGLIAASCGLCTLVFGGASFVSTLGSGGLQYVGAATLGLLLALVMGGLPAAAGVALFLFGRRMYRRGRGPTPVEIDKTFS
jgi:hypothetical protein